MDDMTQLIKKNSIYLVKPIETVYKGYKFRSRIEARWAVFFDAAGIAYEYEKEGFDLGNGLKYLPDFWLPDFGWFEVKGVYPSDDERKKMELLCLGTKHNGFIAFGEIPEINGIFCEHEYEDKDNKANIIAFWYFEGDTDLAKELKIESFSVDSIAEEDCNFFATNNPHNDSIFITLSNDIGVEQEDSDDPSNDYRASVLVNAYQAARQARFEHGANGL